MLRHRGIGASTPQIPLIPDTFTTSTTPQVPSQTQPCNSEAPENPPWISVEGPKPMKDICSVCIIGAGIGGVAAAIAIARAGHRVTILEQAKELTEIGAGIQVPTNSTRILKEWGLLSLIESKASRVGHYSFRSYKDGSVLHSQDMAPTEDIYGVPYLIAHRADYLSILVNEAITLGVTIHLDTAVSGIDFETTAVHPTSNSSTFDAIICADGLKSLSRSLFLGHPSPALPSGHLAYRTTIPTSLLAQSQDPELRLLALEPDVNIWLGPRAHVVTYQMKSSTLLNVVFIKSDDLPESVTTASAPTSEPQTHLQHWDPALGKIFEMAPGGEVLKWRICTSPELESWVHPSGRVALLGDAAHAALPCLAQGAATALEDAYILGQLFANPPLSSSPIPSFSLTTPFPLPSSPTPPTPTPPFPIPTLLNRYSTLRKPRADRLTAASATMRDFDHLVDGPAQVDRDWALRGMRDVKVVGDMRDGDVRGVGLEEDMAEEKGWGDCWLDKGFQEWLFGDGVEIGSEMGVDGVVGGVGGLAAWD